MITVEQLADKFESELNALLDYPNLDFKIWADVGEESKKLRQGNDVFAAIDGNLTTVSSAFTASKLIMGVNTLTLVFGVPLDPPKTTAEQTPQELERIRDGQVWFVQYIAGILSGYFQKYKTFKLEDESGEEFTCGMVAGVTIPQVVDLQAFIGNHVPLSVFIEINIVQGGVVSQDIAIKLDGIDLPFQSFTPDRAGQVDPSVHSGSLITKVILTASAFSAEASIPTNTVFRSSQDVLAFLLGGMPNTAHFLQIIWGADEDAQEAVYLVTFTRATGGMQGVTIASVTFQVAEVQDDVEMLDLPDGFQLGYFVIPSTADIGSQLAFYVTQPCLAYIAGQAFDLIANSNTTFQVSEGDIAYDEETDEYRLYLITSVACSASIVGQSWDFETVE